MHLMKLGSPQKGGRRSEETKPIMNEVRLSKIGSGTKDAPPPDDIEENGAGLRIPLTSIVEKAKFWTKLWKRDEGNRELAARTLGIVRRAALQFRKSAGELSQEDIERGYRELPDKTGKGIEMLPPAPSKSYRRQGVQSSFPFTARLKKNWRYRGRCSPPSFALCLARGGQRRGTGQSPR